MAVDMTYNFRWDAEPTDEQLEQLMREVGEEARESNKEANAKYRQAIREEIKLMKTTNNNK
jgi:ElaB/YqjD/DUF883 family membrane-anchored ribosome-binding protein